jgi:glycosyltransferase involved in cell wall biosynthesis
MSKVSELPQNNHSKNLSVVIPTRNRIEPMRTLLNALLNQTRNPAEIIIVDDSDGSETELLVNKMQTSFFSKGVQLKYTRGKKKSSISAARNIGIDNAKGAIILFFDDDVIPDKQSIEQIINCYRRHSNVTGVAGYFGLLLYPDLKFPNMRFSFLNAFKKVFALTFLENGKKRVLPSGNITLPYNVKEDINCEWIWGGFSSFKADVLKVFRYDEKLCKYSLWEDVDLSFRINKKYPNSLHITPFARAVHKASPIGRRSNSLLTYILVGYHVYFFYKNIKKNIVNRLAFVWSLIGTFIFRLLNHDLNGSILLLKVYCYTLRHLKEIVDGHFPFLDWAT